MEDVVLLPLSSLFAHQVTLPHHCMSIRQLLNGSVQDVSKRLDSNAPVAC